MLTDISLEISFIVLSLVLMDFMFVEKLRYGLLEGTLFFVHGSLQSKAFLSAVFLHELIEINELLTFFDLKYTVFNYKLPFLGAN